MNTSAFEANAEMFNPFRQLDTQKIVFSQENNNNRMGKVQLIKTYKTN